MRAECDALDAFLVLLGRALYRELQAPDGSCRDLERARRASGSCPGVDSAESVARASGKGIRNWKTAMRVRRAPSERATWTCGRGRRAPVDAVVKSSRRSSRRVAEGRNASRMRLGLGATLHTLVEQLKPPGTRAGAGRAALGRGGADPTRASRASARSRRVLWQPRARQRAHPLLVIRDQGAADISRRRSPRTEAWLTGENAARRFRDDLGPERGVTREHAKRSK